MIISERIFKIIKEKNITQAEFGKRAGIPTSTISEWKKRKTNPSADQFCSIFDEVAICDFTILHRFKTALLVQKGLIFPSLCDKLKQGESFIIFKYSQDNFNRCILMEKTDS